MLARILACPPQLVQLQDGGGDNLTTPADVHNCPLQLVCSCRTFGKQPHHSGRRAQLPSTAGVQLQGG